MEHFKTPGASSNQSIVHINDDDADLSVSSLETKYNRGINFNNGIIQCAVSLQYCNHLQLFNT